MRAGLSDQLEPVGEEDVIAIPKVKSKARRPRQGAEGASDIFASFGDDYAHLSQGDEAALKSLNVRRFWKSDLDIRRWQQDLTDNSRFDKLLMDVRSTTNPEFGTYQAELVQKHNALFRQRGMIDKERSAKDNKNAAGELRQIAKQIAPKPKAKKKKTTVSLAFIADGMGFSGFKDKMREDPEPSSSATDSFGTYGDSEVQRSVDVNDEADPEEEEVTRDMMLASNSASFEDPSDIERRLESSGDGRAQKDLSMPSLGFSQSSPSTAPAKQSRVEGKERLPKVQPSTLSLLIYRNGDRHHSGEAVFLRRMPKDMKDLLAACGEGCRVLVGPADALYDSQMRQLREVKDVQAVAHSTDTPGE
jgi:hypothetical protein